jgi:hypothetical protein
MFQVLLMPAEELTHTRPEIELREAPRFACAASQIARATVETHYRPIAFVVRDISVKGIGLIGGVAVKPGTQIAILWDFGDPTSWRTVRATVARSTPGRRGGWDVGCVFAQPLTPSELEELIRDDRYVAGDRSDEN